MCPWPDHTDLESSSNLTKDIFYWDRCVVKVNFTCCNVWNAITLCIKYSTTFSLSLNKIFRDIEISRWLLSMQRTRCFIVRHCCSSSLLDPRIPSLSSGFPLVIPPNSLSTTKAVTLSFSTPYKQERYYTIIVSKTNEEIFPSLIRVILPFNIYWYIVF